MFLLNTSTFSWLIVTYTLFSCLILFDDGLLCSFVLMISFFLIQVKVLLLKILSMSQKSAFCLNINT